MKTKSLLIVVAAVISLANPASAALIAAWDANNTPATSVNPEPAPWDYHDNVIVSSMTMHGSVVAEFSGSPFRYKGFSGSIDTNNYLGFTVRPEVGYQMTLTDFSFVQPDYSGISYSWGYRIGGGAWDMFSGEITFDGTPAFRDFVFGSPIVTTEEVEFGFFASANTLESGLVVTLGVPNRNEIQVNGSVEAVPEPSSAILGVLGACAAISRRRRQAR